MVLQLKYIEFPDAVLLEVRDKVFQIKFNALILMRHISQLFQTRQKKVYMHFQILNINKHE